MRKNKSTRAKSAKKANVKNNVSVEVVKAVESVEVKAESESPVTNLPAVTESGKVSSKEVLKAANTIRASIREERRGANVTIRLIAELAANGDTNAVNILCALCDVPRSALFTLNINAVRAAVNAYYPYYIETEGRKVSVKPSGVWYSTQKDEEVIEDAAKRVQRGYRAVEVADYLDMLIKAAKSRAKGITPRCIDNNAIYSDIAMSETADGVTCNEIDDAKTRKSYLSGVANVWHKDRNGFYI